MLAVSGFTEGCKPCLSVTVKEDEKEIDIWKLVSVVGASDNKCVKDTLHCSHLFEAENPNIMRKKQ